MKKLVLALIAVAVGLVANAGSVRWKMYDVTGTDGTGVFTGGMAYLFTSAIDSGDVETAIKGGTFASAYAGSAIYTSEIEDGEFDTGNILKDVYSGSTTLWMVALDNESTPSYYIIGDDITKTIGGTGAQNFSWTYDDNASAWTSIGGSSVPEPTSGMLLLLGMAGLALRRRRA